jgi:hypothetical protein
VHLRSRTLSTGVRNRDVPWDAFDPDEYFRHNYSHLRPDDAQIIDILLAFFADQPAGVTVLDVGTGSNLYPVLVALPYASRVDVMEPSAAGRAWLREHTSAPPYPWAHLWAYMTDVSPTHAVADVEQLLADRLTVVDGSVFDLPPSAWDVVSMHFVAESITAEAAEFRAAVGSFVRAARLGGSFIASFMENSSGYTVGELRLPAVPVDAGAVESAFRPWSDDVEVVRIPLGEAPLRAGYSGMLIATGRRTR